MDVLLVYEDRSAVVALRGAQPWEEFDQPCRLLAMTPLEVAACNFIKTTGAVRLQ